MKIDICLTASDTKSAYMRHIPTFIKVWSLLNIEPMIILIHHEIPAEFQSYSKYIILFNPIEHKLQNLKTAYIAQTIRIYYPCLLPVDKTVIISDIDIMPIDRRFFISSIANMSDDVFVNYRRYEGQLNICYNVAKAATWKRIFTIETIDDVVKLLHNNYNDNYTAQKNCPGWFTDQQLLTEAVLHYSSDPDTGNKVIFLDKMGYKIHRLDKRNHQEIRRAKSVIINNIGNYTDFHMITKNSYFKLVDELKEAILAHLEKV